MSLEKNKVMKKIIFLCLLIACVSCKKDQFCHEINDLNAFGLPQNLIGKWRWITLEGGFGGGGRAIDSTKQFVMTINANKTYEWCEDKDCQSAKWFFGTKTSNNGRHSDTLLVFESLKNLKTPLSTPINLRQVVNDTLVLGLFCNDCFSPVFVKSK
jgi:hypothetical protein